MAEIGSTINSEPPKDSRQLAIQIGLSLDVTISLKKERDGSILNKDYLAALKNANETLAKALKVAEEAPESGLAVARQCARFVLEALPDPAHDAGRAAALSQFEVLENMLAVVRKPGEYLANMQRQFGPNLDPRQYKGGDAFNSIIKSQRQRLSKDGQSGVFASPEEKLFCRGRGDLLAAVEKAYNQLREKALL